MNRNASDLGDIITVRQEGVSRGGARSRGRDGLPRLGCEAGRGREGRNGVLAAGGSERRTKALGAATAAAEAGSWRR
jgi:hypothetical protein